MDELNATFNLLNPQHVGRLSRVELANATMPIWHMSYGQMTTTQVLDRLSHLKDALRDLSLDAPYRSDVIGEINDLKKYLKALTLIGS